MPDISSFDSKRPGPRKVYRVEICLFTALMNEIGVGDYHESFTAL